MELPKNSDKLYALCITELHKTNTQRSAHKKQSVEVIEEIISADPYVAQRMFYFTQNAKLGKLFIARYAEDENFHNAAYLIARELGKLGVKLSKLEQSLEFKPVQDNPVRSIFQYCFFEEDFKVREHGASERDGSEEFAEYFGSQVEQD